MFLPKTPFSKANHFGIAINSSCVRAMSVGNNGDVIASASANFSAPLIHADTINADQLLASLKQVIEQGGFTQKYAAIAIPEKFAYSRAHTLPKLKPDEIQEAVNWQIEKIFPFSKKEVYVDWKLISDTKTESKVMVTVIPKGILDQLKTTLQAAGVFPISFEPSTSALTRLLDPEAAKKIIILELETTSTTASLVLDGVAILTSTTNFNQNTQPQAVLDQIISSIKSILLHLGKIEETHKDLSILITGEKANQNIADFLTKSIAIPTSVLSVEKAEPQDHLAYIAASANILPPESEKSINLLPTSLQEYYQSHMAYTLSKSVAKYVAGFVILGLLFTSLLFIGVFWTKSSTQNQLLEAKQKTTRVGTSQFNLGEVNKKSQRIIKLFPLKVSPEQYLVTLYNSIPENIILQEVALTRAGAVKLTGQAPDRESLVILRDAITETGIFTTPKIPLTAYQDNENVPFVLNFSVTEEQQ